MDAVYRSSRPVRLHRLSRRQVLFDLGWGGVAVTVLAGCSTGSTGSSGPGNTAPSGTASSSSGSAAAGTTATTATTAPTAELAWKRVDFGFVSAYLLARGSSVVVVDTGVAGSADAIGSALQAASASWDSVTDVVLTHHHPDHAGSVADVAARASRAVIHAGAADIDNITRIPRPIVAAADGSDILGMQVVATPGHTDGHISVFDRGTHVLVAGDALGNTAGLTGSNPQFTSDPVKATESVKILAALDAGTILFGHGEPLTSTAAEALRTFAGTL
jgi:glyoxylase-like metal-dependent hydrolase (beta-lactamase superfamily II)